jgi:hypothetical protein
MRAHDFALSMFGLRAEPRRLDREQQRSQGREQEQRA